ncbi:SH3 domain-containing protein [Massilia sp. W12]|uniref:SH3 domain-containing protein n=1 Tax=Massilia sp. W12 TaxID=3126507 RepID=UPI0030D4D07E
MKSVVSHITALALALAAPVALAADFKSIGAQPAVLYDTPSAKGKKLFVAPRGMPVEVVMEYGEWRKVRDASGSLAWLEAKALSPKRMLVAQSNGVKVRAAAEEGAFIAFTVDKGVLLEMADGQSGNAWLKVRHRDGQAGFVKAGEVWGE